MTENTLWLLVVAGGPVLIGLIMGFASLTTRRMREREREINEPHHHHSSALWHR